MTESAHRGAASVPPQPPVKPAQAPAPEGAPRARWWSSSLPWRTTFPEVWWPPAPREHVTRVLW